MADQTPKVIPPVPSIVPSAEASSLSDTEAFPEQPNKEAPGYTERGAPEDEIESSSAGDTRPWLVTTDEDFLPLPLSPSWINLDTIRDWIRTCISDHGPTCWPLEGLSGLPVWLIDVKEYCLVPATAQHTYLALSYVWGGVPSTETTRSNLEALQSPGALSPSNYELEIPKTIRHTMELVNLLGQRYLWVDRLCICQDDEEKKASQIDIMGDIYGNALVTIIAASGWDANHGLRGIKGVTDPRNLAPNAGDDFFKSIQPQSSIWYSRGWTFQELFFSRRKLMFHYQTVIWECGCTTWHEIHGSQKVYGGSPGIQINPGHFDRLLTGGEKSSMDEAGLRVWISMVNQYNIRNLTYPEDVSRAFAGLANAFTKVQYPNGFLWGLPIDCFHASLLWISEEPLKRRLPTLAESEAPPSWSWMGWQGSIMNDVWMDMRDQRDFPVSWRTALEALSPECDWFYVEEQDLSNPRPVLPGNHAFKPRSYLISHTEIATFYLFEYGVSFIDAPSGFLFRTRPLVNSDGKFSGFLMGGTDLDLLENGLEVEYLDISSSTNKILGGGSWEGYVYNHENYYNILWVSRRDDVLTRQGMGRILKDAWDMNEERSLEIVKLS